MTCSNSCPSDSEPDPIQVYEEYLRVFSDKWGISREHAVFVGVKAKPVLSAEFTIRGKAMYQDSVFMALRNAAYSANTAKPRYTSLRAMGLRNKVFDYGCGVGFLVKYLTAAGYDAVGYDLPGVQTDVAEAAGVRIVQPDRAALKGRDVICLNVIEHLEDPIGFTRHLLDISPRLFANICMDRCDKQHIAPLADLVECRKILMKSDAFVVIEVPDNGKQ